MQAARAAYPFADPYFGGIVAAYGAQAVVSASLLFTPPAGIVRICHSTVVLFVVESRTQVESVVSMV